MLKKNVTIYDIAREAGVSPATVSRILTGATAVRTEKRDRVMALIEKYNYHPNALARALTETQSHLIGLLVADSDNPYYTSVFAACENEAFRRGYAILMMNSHSRPGFETAMLTKLRELRPDAMIICGGRVDLEQPDEEFNQLLSSARETTRVVVGSQSPMPGIPGVAVDHQSSVDLAVRYLAGLGHRDIGFVYTGTPYYGTQLRLKRFREALSQLGLPFREEWLIHVPDYGISSGLVGVERLMQLPQRPTALLGMNDMVSAGILQGLLGQGLRVPRDISLLGFDDTFVTGITTPQLTSVSYDYQLFASMLLDAALRPDALEALPQNQLVPVFMTERASCAPPAPSPGRP